MTRFVWVKDINDALVGINPDQVLCLRTTPEATRVILGVVQGGVYEVGVRLSPEATAAMLTAPAAAKARRKPPPKAKAT